MLLWLGLDDVVLVVVSSALVLHLFLAPALLMTATATTLPGPTLTDAAPSPPLPSLPSCACPAYEFILCAIAAFWQSFAQNSPAVLSCLTGRCASGHDEDDSLGKFSPDRESESYSQFPMRDAQIRII